MTGARNKEAGIWKLLLRSTSVKTTADIVKLRQDAVEDVGSKEIGN